jgi:superfamily II DNA/RNA helicase
MGADGVAIAFVTPEQGDELTAIEAFINQELKEERIEGFQAFQSRAKQTADPEPKKIVPVFGRTIRRYSRRL